MAEIKSFVPHGEYTKYSADEMRVRAQSFHQNLKRRRTVRDFLMKIIPRDVIERLP